MCGLVGNYELDNDEPSKIIPTKEVIEDDCLKCQNGEVINEVTPTIGERPCSHREH